MNQLDLNNLQKMIDEKYISVQQHPRTGLYIYNYTQKAQFERVWNNETLQCRGLIMDEKFNIKARPFPKFFNLAEIIARGEQIPAEDFIVTEKMDGSLGILYWEGNEPRLATRGSFTSDQALHGTEILQSKYKKVPFSKDGTYLFEIIYPSNRIVVDYGDKDDVVLLTAIATESGEEFSYDLVKAFSATWKIPVVKKYDAIRDFSNIEQRPNSEGYVIAFPSTGQRFKIKFDEYVRLHRLITGVNAKAIWELLRNNQPFDELLEKVPDEFFDWVNKTKADLIRAYEQIEGQAIMDYGAILKEIGTDFERKEFAEKAKQTKYSGLVFSLLDHRPYADKIWMMVKPKAERPFKEEI